MKLSQPYEEKFAKLRTLGIASLTSITAMWAFCQFGVMLPLPLHLTNPDTEERHRDSQSVCGGGAAVSDDVEF